MRAAKCVRRGGVLGAIIPSSITDAESGSLVRGSCLRNSRRCKNISTWRCAPAGTI
jgi:hypothetical protein